jgi:hypothetical protein
VLVGIEGDSIMRRHIAIGLAVAVITFASASNVSAHGGHGGGGGGAAAHAGSVGSFSGGHSFAFSGSHAALGNHASFGSHAAFGNHFVGRGFGFRHRFHRHLFFAGAPYAYGYDDDCYARIWTRWGWGLRNVCY